MGNPPCCVAPLQSFSPPGQGGVGGGSGRQPSPERSPLVLLSPLAKGELEGVLRPPAAHSRPPCIPPWQGAKEKPAVRLGLSLPWPRGVRGGSGRQPSAERSPLVLQSPCKGGFGGGFRCSPALQGKALVGIVPRLALPHARLRRHAASQLPPDSLYLFVPSGRPPHQARSPSPPMNETGEAPLPQRTLPHVSRQWHENC